MVILNVGSRGARCYLWISQAYLILPSKFLLKPKNLSHIFWIYQGKLTKSKQLYFLNFSLLSQTVQIILHEKSPPNSHVGFMDQTHEFSWKKNILQHFGLTWCKVFSHKGHHGGANVFLPEALSIGYEYCLIRVWIKLNILLWI